MTAFEHLREELLRNGIELAALPNARRSRRCPALYPGGSLFVWGARAVGVGIGIGLLTSYCWVSAFGSLFASDPCYPACY